MKEASLQSQHENKTATNLTYTEVESLLNAKHGNASFYRASWPKGEFLFIEISTKEIQVVRDGKIQGPARFMPDDLLANDWIVEAM
ncbi:hypothetical protein [Tatumella sp. OPLPL6]|uniref:hypothetical protein n=1 Tax=Tatumella sp. OPLPL6 TaxID=1928657 RepID=UPI000C1845B8|nr:hypothetical protein [Tatumella sp. OPLPL6]PIJ43354.1 hypothetical protein BOM24_09320 [Tatumella sp. OPLPL6]